MTSPLCDLAQALRTGAVTAQAAAETQLATIAATEPTIGAWQTLDRAHVLAEAHNADADLPAGPLAGVGIGVKDKFSQN